MLAREKQGGAALSPRATWLTTLLAVALTCLSFSHVGSADEFDPHPAVRSDVPFIKCGVCEIVAAELVKGTARVKREKKFAFRVEDVHDVIEEVCDIKKGGEWAMRVDLFEDGDGLTVILPGGISRCGQECSTAVRACRDVIEETDVIELAEELYSGKITAGDARKSVCRRLSTACDEDPPPVPKTRKPGPPFKPMTSEEIKVWEMIKKVDGMEGVKPEVLSRDEMEREHRREQGLDSDDEDEDEGEEEDASGAAGSSGEDEESAAAAGGEASAAGDKLELAKETAVFLGNLAKNKTVAFFERVYLGLTLIVEDVQRLAGKVTGSAKGAGPQGGAGAAGKAKGKKKATKKGKKKSAGKTSKEL
ncbi:unnamed protein product [Pedinophyceae sp. YPF-701]|nr:unnamed protein product [Pedinophyceae sp. YPF-701]